MLTRCRNSRHKDYRYYGAKGVTVCERWQSFELFLADMGARPTPLASLDRIDNSKGYAPDNCRWATPQEQNYNKSTTLYLTKDGITKSLRAWSVETGINRGTILSRVKDYGWSEEDAVTEPVSFVSRRLRGQTA